MSDKYKSFNQRYNSNGKTKRHIISANQASVDRNEATSSNVGSSQTGGSVKRPAENNWADSSGVPLQKIKSTGTIQPVGVAAIEGVESTMGLTGTGAEQASGGASSDGQMTHYTDVPRTLFGDNISVYKKVHKVMTFGLAPNIITPTGTGEFAARRYLTSYLADIPWNIPAFYMNPSEFGLLHDGARCLEVKISVVYRGSTIQFQTNQTTTSLATLNQINDISVAHALNKTGWGSNGRYTGFIPTNTMVPTGVADPALDVIPGVYRGLVADLYGTNNNDPNFEEYIPHSQIGDHVFLYNHWLTTTRIDAGVPNANNLTGGWPAIAEKIKQMDGKTVVNTVVLDMEYKPKMAPLKLSHRTYFIGLPKPTNAAAPANQLSVNVDDILPANRIAGITVTNTPPTATGPTNIENVAESLNQMRSYNPGFNQPTIYTLIEKSNYLRTGSWGDNNSHVQPSAHIGVQPVPSLTTTSLLTDNLGQNSWTDCRGYWEITATMVVKQNEPTALPYAQFGNVPIGDEIQATTSVPGAYGALYAGRLTNSAFTLNG